MLSFCSKSQNAVLNAAAPTSSDASSDASSSLSTSVSSAAASATASAADDLTDATVVNGAAELADGNSTATVGAADSGNLDVGDVDVGNVEVGNVNGATGVTNDAAAAEPALNVQSAPVPSGAVVVKTGVGIVMLSFSGTETPVQTLVPSTAITTAAAAAILDVASRKLVSLRD